MPQIVDPNRPDAEFVPSFTEDDIDYLVNRVLDCECDERYRNKELTSCKHSRLVQAIEWTDFDLKKACRGILQDGTPVIVLESLDTTIYRRTFGFEPGVYSHELCWDGNQLLVVSTDLATEEEVIRIIYEASAWDRHIPKDQTLRDRKTKNRRPDHNAPAKES